MTWYVHVSIILRGRTSALLPEKSYYASSICQKILLCSRIKPDQSVSKISRHSAGRYWQSINDNQKSLASFLGGHAADSPLLAQCSSKKPIKEKMNKSGSLSYSQNQPRHSSNDPHTQHDHPLRHTPPSPHRYALGLNNSRICSRRCRRRNSSQST